METVQRLEVVNKHEQESKDCVLKEAISVEYETWTELALNERKYSELSHARVLLGNEGSWHINWLELVADYVSTELEPHGRLQLERNCILLEPYFIEYHH